MSSPPVMVSVVSQRNSDGVVLYLSPKQAPPVLPYELHGHVSPDSWASRIPVINRLTARYNKPLFEGIYFLVYFIASIALPAVFYPMIFRALDKNHNDNDNFSDFHDDRFFDQDRPFFQARAASLGIWLAVTVLFWTPYLLWKRVGQKHATILGRRWEGEDARTRGAGAFVPSWKIQLPGFYSNSTKLTMSLPPNQMPTSFHPAVYQQSWINGPVDPGNPYPGGPGFQAPGYQNPGSYGNVPLYQDEKAPAYTNQGGATYPDEKQHFDDVRV
ncbi:hypothetical protein FA95DRAFT_1128044 [Auriscalpium vulgare]|uniref:Uncharacterized protein n=1 Tax=Auriscalpium vulgare TaxID=40419 RepID=A0ACB8R5K6_9AGAM|nr:hypothetical protein FA95DRAFT_1128044 [Auriscalpium vulgare]